MRRFTMMVGLAAVQLLLGVPAAGQQETATSFVPVTDSMLRNPDPADWLMWRGTLGSWGYSPLVQISRATVHQLTLAWSRAMRPGAPQEGTPLVYRGVMYMPNPGDVIQALDAKTGDLLWEYRRKWPDNLADHFIAPFVNTNRNLAIHGRLIIDTSADGFVFALDASTGQLVWETRILDYRKGGLQTFRADHCRRQGNIGPWLRAQEWPRGMRHYGARCDNGCRALAFAHHSSPGGAGGRELGRCSIPRAASRWNLDGAEL